MKSTILLLAASMAAIGSMAANAQQAVTGIEVQKALQNKRVSLACADGTNGSGRYMAVKNVGMITGTYSAPGAQPISDTGIVRAQGNNLCVQFKQLKQGVESCFDVQKVNDRQFEFSTSGLHACTLSVL